MRFRGTSRAGRALAVATLLALPAARAGADQIQSPLFSITDLGPATEAMGVNNAGTVVGTTSGSAFTYASGGVQPTTPTPAGSGGGGGGGSPSSPSTSINLKTIDGLGTGYSLAHAINDSGQIVGSLPVQTQSGVLEHAFIQSNGQTTDLGTLGGRFSGALAINKNGVVVGSSELANGQTHGFVYQNGQLQDVGTLGGNQSDARLINDSGQIAGSSQTAAGFSHAFLLSDGTMKDLGVLNGGTTSFAFGLNNAGSVVGYSQDASANTRAFLYSGGTMKDLNAPNQNNVAAAINNNGQIVGWGFDKTAIATDYRAWWFDGTQMRDLSSLIPTNSGWDSLNGAVGITDSGQIIGWGTINGSRHAFLLTPFASGGDPGSPGGGPGEPSPVPEPTTIAFMGLVGLGLGVRRLRRRAFGRA